jgi:outer membrane PBP1 activator LpoA protein
MKLKTATAGFALLVLIFCTIQISQGANSNATNVHFMAPPNEHPWQDSGSPVDKDTVQAERVRPILVMITPFEIVMIKPVIKVIPNSSKAQVADNRSYGRTSR